jgi:hypothetical protein
MGSPLRKGLPRLGRSCGSRFLLVLREGVVSLLRLRDDVVAFVPEHQQELVSIAMAVHLHSDALRTRRPLHITLHMSAHTQPSVNEHSYLDFSCSTVLAALGGPADVWHRGGCAIKVPDPE